MLVLCSNCASKYKVVSNSTVQAGYATSVAGGEGENSQSMVDMNFHVARHNPSRPLKISHDIVYM